LRDHEHEGYRLRGVNQHFGRKLQSEAGKEKETSFNGVGKRGDGMMYQGKGKVTILCVRHVHPRREVERKNFILFKDPGGEVNPVRARLGEGNTKRMLHKI